MKRELVRDYRRFRASGFAPAHALYAAKTLEAWNRLEDAGLVQIVAEEEEEFYFDVYGEPDDERERERICDIIERSGCWCVVGQYRTSERQEWQRADSIGMCVGYDDVTSPFDNFCVPDIMEATIEALKAELKSRCACCRQPVAA